MRVSSFFGLVEAALAVCNGHEKLCGRQYSNITWVGSHNSAFVGKTFVHNQFVTVTEQLDLGVRFLQAQTLDNYGRIDLCHTTCWELDVGPLENYLQEIANWMKCHPTNVVTLLLTNRHAISVERFDACFNRTELKKYVFHQRHVIRKDEWPTLQDMIDHGTRLVIFMDFYSNQSIVNYILSEFDYFWETPYGITDSDFPTCSVDRPDSGDPDTLMGIMNHMLNFRIGSIVMPDMFDAAATNSFFSIKKQVDLCTNQGKPQPNVILLDWIDIGEAQKAQQVLNGFNSAFLFIDE